MSEKEKYSKDKWSDGNPTKKQVWQATDRRNSYAHGSEMRKVANTVIHQNDVGYKANNNSYDSVSAAQWQDAKFLAKDGNITK
jgi:hypothetical protein